MTEYHKPKQMARMSQLSLHFQCQLHRLVLFNISEYGHICEMRYYATCLWNE